MKTAYHDLYCDGACRGNPGPMGAGAVLCSPDGGVVAEGYWFLGHGTNNLAEWQALIEGLKLAHKHGVRFLRICMDSELVVKQVRGEYRVRQPRLKPIYELAMQLLQTFADYQIDHVRREQNGQADALANAAIERALN